MATLTLPRETIEGQKTPKRHVRLVSESSHTRASIKVGDVELPVMYSTDPNHAFPWRMYDPTAFDPDINILLTCPCASV